MKKLLIPKNPVTKDSVLRIVAAKPLDTIHDPFKYVTDRKIAEPSRNVTFIIVESILYRT